MQMWEQTSKYTSVGDGNICHSQPATANMLVHNLNLNLFLYSIITRFKATTTTCLLTKRWATATPSFCALNA